MKSILFFLFLPLMSCSAASPLIELKGGYFFFKSHKLNRIYNLGGEDIQLSASYPLVCLNSWIGPVELDLYGSAEFIERSGRSLGAHQKTHFQQFPFNLGLKPVISLTNHFKAYTTFGSRYVLTRPHNFSNYVNKRFTKGGVGLFANLGLLYQFDNCVTLDVFGEYSYVRVTYGSHKTNVMGHTIDVGGYTFGGGLSYKF